MPAQYTIGGCQVHFPHQAYGVQLSFMSKVIAALEGGHNALLEAPTGVLPSPARVAYANEAACRVVPEVLLFCSCCAEVYTFSEYDRKFAPSSVCVRTACN